MKVAGWVEDGNGCGWCVWFSIEEPNIEPVRKQKGFARSSVSNAGCMAVLSHQKGNLGLDEKTLKRYTL